MKKRMALLLVVLAMMLTVPAFAVQMRSAGVYPHLSFNGTTATCVVTVEGENSTDRIGTVKGYAQISLQTPAK